MRKLAIVLALFVFPLFVTALRYSLGDHYIFVTIDSQGNAKVTERFNIAFKTQQDIEEFQQKKTTIGNNISEWERLNPMFTFHIGGKTNVKTESISVSFKDFVLEISYELSAKMVHVIDDRSRMTIYETNKWAFTPFIKGTDYVIPEHTFITFILPPDATIIEEGELFKYATVEKSPPKIMLQGLVATSNLSFRYIYWKGIAPQFSISLAIKQLVEKADNYMVVIAAIILTIVAVILYLARKKIAQKITRFIIKNTEFALSEHELK